MTLTQKVFILKSIKPFDKLSDAELLLLADIISVKKYKKGSKIYSKENNLYNLYVIIDGEVVDDDQNKVDGYFGIKELLNDDVMENSFYANDDVTLFLISKAHLLTLLYESPSLMIGFLSEGAE
jgi:signal-transduction protein with cAMP-binding, CBS, and nucleotidyltransferase domain